MNFYLKQQITKGNCILLLGAGASYNSLDSKKRPLLMGENLSKELCTETGITHQPGQLSKVYEIAKRKLGAKLIHLLEERFSGTTPSNELNRLSKYVWQRIYTLNIDDATETAFHRNSHQSIKVINRTDPWREIDQQLSRLDIIKLNGCINRAVDGFIFSPLEYSSAANNPPEWYKQLGRDFINYTFIFIGTKIDEPLFYQQLEYYKNCWSGTPGAPGEAFVITPDIDEISQEFFHSLNVTHIKGTLKTLIDWIESDVNLGKKPSEVAAIKHPELLLIESGSRQIEQDLLKVCKVSGLNKLTSEKQSGKTREFYLGFKPTWEDIFDNIPAELDFHHTLKTSLTNHNKLNILIGPAGSGKSTALMKAAAHLSSNGSSVYYLKEPISSLDLVIDELDKIHDKNYYFFIDKITTVIDGLIKSLEKNTKIKVIFVCGERLNVWKQRAESATSRFNPSISPKYEVLFRIERELVFRSEVIHDLFHIRLQRLSVAAFRYQPSVLHLVP